MSVKKGKSIIQMPGLPGSNPDLGTPAEPREEVCVNCEYCQPLNAQQGQCRYMAPVPCVMVQPDRKPSLSAHPDYIPIRHREGMSKELLADAEKRPVALLNFPHPWPQMMIQVEWCRVFKKKRVVQVSKVMPH